MKAWTEITHYAGLDWARDHHDIVIVDRAGQVVADLRELHRRGFTVAHGAVRDVWRVTPLQIIGREVIPAVAEL